MAERVVVTAGANGIGLAIARAFLAAHAQVYICDIDAGALQSALRNHQGLMGEVADVANEADVDRTFSNAAETMGGIDCLVNNAGIGGPRAAIEDIALEDWERTLRVNLTG